MFSSVPPHPSPCWRGCSSVRLLGGFFTVTWVPQCQLYCEVISTLPPTAPLRREAGCFPRDFRKSPDAMFSRSPLVSRDPSPPGARFSLPYPIWLRFPPSRHGSPGYAAPLLKFGGSRGHFLTDTLPGVASLPASVFIFPLNYHLAHSWTRA